MSTVAIICEYDPFHKGHQKQIEIIREHFGSDTTVISLMSGSVVQRGRLSVYPKHLRAEAAVRNGSDLVLELPCPYSCSSAEFFATGAVSILNALGGVDHLAFGSECGDTDVLTKAAEIISSEEYLSAIRTSDDAVSHIKAAEEAFVKAGGESFPSTPNDILGVEYIAALKRTGSKISPFTYKREPGYSATASRRVLEELGDASPLIPEGALSLFAKSTVTDPSAYYAVSLHTLRNTSSDTLSDHYAMNGGVAGMIKNAADISSSFPEFIQGCTCKSYTSARIRRAVLSAVLGISADMPKKEPLFTNLLASNEKGRTYLHSVKKTAKINVVTKTADGLSLPENAKTQFEINLRADKLMALCRGESVSDIFKKSPVVL